MSLVSVIMPAFNAGNFLSEAVQSILQQENVSFELILVDDHSTDDSFTLISSLLSNSKIKTITTQGKGVVAAMQTGMQYAQGDYIARMDADDIALPRRLRIQLDYLKQQPEIGIAGGKVAFIKENGLDTGFDLYQQWLNSLTTPAQIEKEIFVESPVPNPTAFMRREVYQQLGGYQDPKWAEDYDMWLRAYQAGIKMGKPEEVILHWRDHGQRLTRCSQRYDNSLFLQAKAFYLNQMHTSLVANRPILIWGTGPTGLTFYDALLAQGLDSNGFVEVHPRRIGGVKRGKPVIHFEELSGYADAFIIGAVGARGAREEIRQSLLAMGKKEQDDFLFVA